MAVLPAGKKTVALIAFFGGQCGTAIVDLGADTRKLFNKAIRTGYPIECAFSIPLGSTGHRPLQTRSIQQVAAVGDINELLLQSRADAKFGERWK
jgi:hypothetical protein